MTRQPHDPDVVAEVLSPELRTDAQASCQFVDLQLKTGEIVISGRAIDADSFRAGLGPLQPSNVELIAN